MLPLPASFLRTAVSAAVLCMLAACISPAGGKRGDADLSVSRPDGSRNAAAYAMRLGPRFEANLGQTASNINFTTRLSGGALFLGPDEAILALPVFGTANGEKAGKDTDGLRAKLAALQAPAPSVTKIVTLGMKLSGANKKGKIIGLNKLGGVVHRYAGTDPKAWRTGIPTYAAVRYADVYPGIDLTFSFDKGQLQYEYSIEPGANPQSIRHVFSGAESLRVDRTTGDLVMETPAGDVRHSAPKILQLVNGRQKAIDGGFTVNGREVGFRIGAYDRTRPLIIDPVISVLTGGTIYQGNGHPTRIAVAPDGSIYVCGWSVVLDPLPDQAEQFEDYDHVDAFVAKYDPSDLENFLIGLPEWTVYFSSRLSDQAEDIATDGNGNAYIVGSITNVDSPPDPPGSNVGFPVLNALQPDYNGRGEAFVARVRHDGVPLSLSFFGGLEKDEGHAIAIEHQGGDATAIYIGGETTSAGIYANSPAVTPSVTVLPFNGGSPGISRDGFVLKLDGTAQTTAYFGYYGGTGVDAITGIAVHDGAAYVTGWTTSPDLFTVAPYQACLSDLQEPSDGPCADTSNAGLLMDAFLAKFQPNPGSTVLSGVFEFSTYFGGTDWEMPTGVAVDENGQAFITGSITTGYYDPAEAGFAAVPFMTTPNAYQTEPGGTTDAFVSAFASDGSAPLFSTFLGGPGEDHANDIVINSHGVFLAGTTDSGDALTQLPTPLPLGNAGAPPGDDDAFVALMTDSLDSLVSWARLGGSGVDQGTGIADANDQGAYVTGPTESDDFRPEPNPLIGGPVIGEGIDNSTFIVGLRFGQPGSADLSITKSDSADPVIAGSNLVYELRVRNDGPDFAWEIVVTDTLPDSFAYDGFQSIPPGALSCEEAAGTVTCEANGILAPQRSVRALISVVTSIPGMFENEADVDSYEDDPDPPPGPDALPDDHVVERTTVNPAPPTPSLPADLTVVKSVETDGPRAGYNLDYDVKVINLGPNDAQNVSVTEELPEDAEYVRYSSDRPDAVACPDQPQPDGTLTCTITDVGAGEENSVTITITMRPTISGPLRNRATVTSLVNLDLNPANNVAEVDAAVGLACNDFAGLPLGQVAPAIGGPNIHKLVNDDVIYRPASFHLEERTLPGGQTVSVLVPDLVLRLTDDIPVGAPDDRPELPFGLNAIEIELPFGVRWARLSYARLTSPPLEVRGFADSGTQVALVTGAANQPQNVPLGLTITSFTPMHKLRVRGTAGEAYLMGVCYSPNFRSPPPGSVVPVD